MPVTIKTKIGAHLIEVTGDTFKEAIELGSLLSELPQKCGTCASPDIALNHRVAQTYSFYGLRCRACGAEYPLGQKKNMADLFPKGPWQMPDRHSGHDVNYDAEPRHADAQDNARAPQRAYSREVDGPAFDENGRPMMD